MSKYKPQKYNDLSEIIEAMKTKWGGLWLEEGQIPDTPENRTIVQDGLFWIGVEMVRFTYTADTLNFLFKWFQDLKRVWGDFDE